MPMFLKKCQKCGRGMISQMRYNAGGAYTYWYCPICRSADEPSHFVYNFSTDAKDIGFLNRTEKI